MGVGVLSDLAKIMFQEVVCLISKITWFRNCSFCPPIYLVVSICLYAQLLFSLRTYFIGKLPALVRLCLL